MLTTAGRALLLSGGFAGTITHLGLANSTGTELTGGSPAYARKAVTWNSPSGGAMTQSGSLTFDVPAGSEVARVLARGASSGGTDYGYGWVGGFPVQVGTVSSSTDAVTSYSHGYANGDRVGVHPVGGGSLPSPLTEGLYYVINASTDTFSFATAAGGSAVNVAASGELWLQKCVPEQFSQQGTFTVSAGNASVTATAI